MASQQHHQQSKTQLRHNKSHRQPETQLCHSKTSSVLRAYPYERKWSYHNQRRANSTISTAAMPMLKMTAALLSPATAASLKWAYTMHMDTRLKKKSPQSKSES